MNRSHMYSLWQTLHEQGKELPKRSFTHASAQPGMAASDEKAELMGVLAERMQGIAEQAAAMTERVQRASQLAVRARECAELYGGM